MVALKRLLVVLAIALLAASPLEAKEWARKLFDKTSHDFGTVARGAKVEARFSLENVYVEDVHITSVKSSCGCTSVKASKELLKTYDVAEIVAELDTRRFYGYKGSTITVTFDRPFPAEVQLQVKSFIRGDVVFEPGSVQFGSVDQGQPQQQKVKVTYAGRADWRIEEIFSSAGYLECVGMQTARSTDPASGATTVTYELTVSLKPDAPPGYFKESLTLRTNDTDSQKAKVPLSVEGMIAAPLTVNPSVWMVGNVPANETKSKVLVLQGNRPFRVTEVASADPRFRFKTRDQAGKTQIVAVEFAAGATPGKIAETIQVKTDLNGAAVEVRVSGEVLSPSGALPSGLRPGPLAPPEPPSPLPPSDAKPDSSPLPITPAGDSSPQPELTSGPRAAK